MTIGRMVVGRDARLHMTLMKVYLHFMSPGPFKPLAKNNSFKFFMYVCFAIASGKLPYNINLTALSLLQTLLPVLLEILIGLKKYTRKEL
jgi:hypothetical protein